ncbi:MULTISPECIES: sugar ABC transporter ATP-binding protein [unclassified Micromonospora]|uniref:sugar ABC transporter ATP-binding protein n=1 Tax=unclassified Micromonospora TaxID=2617518 RepID=UPI001B37A7FE|nr:MULTISPECIES: sugar ABC transporter ATP-binding protein [unclassified Micromonospora]MBQ1046829.1 sugar ABC transporter ATP-binding protein [Micromonospora sp. C72]MBQ1059088.1 sugar ABC transporter ATP-binding protein [Micromonospora sp. C32]
MTGAGAGGVPGTSGRVVVAATGLAKRFGGVTALDGVDFDVRAGEVHALLGENGAGKSTLINILSGVVTDYDGAVTVDGTPVRFTGPAAAQAAGIATIHQELDLVPGLSVADNLVLGREPRTRMRTVDRRATVRTAREHLDRLGADIDPRRPVGSLRVGEQQLVEIAKALALDARVLVMDEPTAALADGEVRRLFATIDGLRRRGVGVVYISHRMEEIEVVADRATVLRNGCVAGVVPAGRMDRRRIVTMMVGERATSLFAPASGDAAGRAGRREPLLDLTDLAVRPRSPRPGRCEPDGISLTVRTGEIVGLAGLMGAGRTELLETLFGAGPAGRRAGTVRLAGRPYAPRSPRAALRAGVGFVPEDRRRAALVLEHPVGRSIVLAALARLTTAGIVRRGRERAAVARSVTGLAIRTESTATPVGALSGGNQQKVVFARHLLTEPRLLLLDEPTRGVDIGAKAEIYRLLRRLADDGVGILIASSELPELLGVCDRVVVLRRGRTVADLATDGCTGADVLAAAMGGPAAGRDDR